MTVWNEKTDVIVVGYGLAGAIAAIEACDAGAEVTVLEKSLVPRRLLYSLRRHYSLRR